MLHRMQCIFVTTLLRFEINFEILKSSVCRKLIWEQLKKFTKCPPESNVTQSSYPLNKVSTKWLNMISTCQFGLSGWFENEVRYSINSAPILSPKRVLALFTRDFPRWCDLLFKQRLRLRLRLRLLVRPAIIRRCRWMLLFDIFSFFIRSSFHGIISSICCRNRMAI